MPGPPPKPANQRRRRNAAIAMTQLPPDGRPGDPPEWPLTKLASKTLREREAAIWAGLWATPPAVMWERLRWTRVVARYVRCIVMLECEFGTKLAAEVRQLEDRLGLNSLALLKLRWEIPGKEDAQTTGPTPHGDEDLAERRRRLKVV